MAQSNADLDALLDTTLDDLADLPSFEAWPAGTYQAQIIELGMKAIGAHPSFCFKLKNKGVVELTEEDAVPPKEGDETELVFMMDNEIGQGKLKEVSSGVMETLGATTFRQLKDTAKGVEVIVVLNRKFSKEKDRWFADLKAMTLA